MSDFVYAKKRAVYFNAADYAGKPGYTLTNEEKDNFTKFDVIYRALCAILYNYAPLSGHPGGSISCGRFISHLVFNSMKYDFNHPWRLDADVLTYAAGHKALGMYAMYALRNECAAQSAPSLLPKDIKQQLRLEDLLGFRRNSATDTPLFKKLNVKPLGGHAEPLTPFVKTATGASGVGFGAGVGMA